MVEYVGIKPAHAGFGEYDTTFSDGEAVELDCFLDECSGEIIELCDGTELPDWAKDIRGLIHDEPDLVYARKTDEETVEYFGFNYVGGFSKNEKQT